MKSKSILLLWGLAMSGCFTVKSNDRFTYQKLTVHTYYQHLLDHPNSYLIDVRTPGEYAKSHAPGAVNYNFLAGHFGRDVDTLNRNQTAYIYCHTCHRSPFAAKVMKRKGFRQVIDLEKGFSQWLKARLPVDST